MSSGGKGLTCICLRYKLMTLIVPSSVGITLYKDLTSNVTSKAYQWTRK